MNSPSEFQICLDPGPNSKCAYYYMLNHLQKIAVFSGQIETFLSQGCWVASLSYWSACLRSLFLI